MEQRGLRRAARDALFRRGVQPVLEQVEIEAAEIHHAEVVDLLVDQVVLVLAIGLDDFLVQRGGARQRPAVDGHHLLHRQRIRRRIEAREVAQQEAHGVAHAPIRIGDALEDFVRHAHFVGVVGGRDPQAHDIGAERRHHLLRQDHVAQRLGHLAALVVHGESVRQHALVRRARVQRLGHQQRRMEPAAMLVRAFEVQIDRRLHIVGMRVMHALVREARIGPHVHDVGDLLVGVGVVA